MSNDKYKQEELDLAKKIAKKAHDGQFRRDNKTPYIEHPRAVVNLLEGSDEYILMTAWLHDVLEDTKVTADELFIEGIPIPVINAVELLTKKEGVDYMEYLRTLSKNPMARVVKLADIVSNLNDAPSDKQIKKYLKALPILLFPKAKQHE